jgi:hypothetical protein
MEFVTKKIKVESVKPGMVLLDNKNQKIVVQETIPLSSKNLVLLNCTYDDGAVPVEMILEKNSFITALL